MWLAFQLGIILGYLLITPLFKPFRILAFEGFAVVSALYPFCLLFFFCLLPEKMWENLFILETESTTKHKAHNPIVVSLLLFSFLSNQM